jgi:hypothetical protein
LKLLRKTKATELSLSHFRNEFARQFAPVLQEWQSRQIHFDSPARPRCQEQPTTSPAPPTSFVSARRVTVRWIQFNYEVNRADIEIDLMLATEHRSDESRDIANIVRKSWNSGEIAKSRDGRFSHRGIL